MAPGPASWDGDWHRPLDVHAAAAGVGDPPVQRHRSQCRLVVDSGFFPHRDGPRGNLHPAAAALPHVVTPVPGGIGPVEMAVLAERVIQQEAAHSLEPWHFHGLDTLHPVP